MTFDYCVLGAGLAGLSIADKLSEHNYKVAVIDPKGIAAGASGVPIGLVNPATGRYASMSWKGIECYNAILKTLEQVQARTKTILFSKPGVIRPAISEEYALKMKTVHAETDWPEGWCYWLDRDEVAERFPGLKCVGGGIWLPIDLNVRMPQFLEAYSDMLREREVQFHTSEPYTLTQAGEHWNINLADKTNIEAKNIITTAGSKSCDVQQWSFLPLHPIKGQIIILKTKEPFPYSSTVYASGYSTKFDKNSFAAGSTYEHDFTDEEPDSEGLDRILGNLSIVLPDVKESILETKQWAGIRASTPNRLPILGRHPKFKNSYIFTGLGSKGLLFSSYLAEQLYNYIEHSIPLHPRIDVARI